MMYKMIPFGTYADFTLSAFVSNHYFFSFGSFLRDVYVFYVAVLINLDSRYDYRPELLCIGTNNGESMC